MSLNPLQPALLIHLSQLLKKVTSVYIQKHGFGTQNLISNFHATREKPSPILNSHPGVRSHKYFTAVVIKITHEAQRASELFLCSAKETYRNVQVHNLPNSHKTVHWILSTHIKDTIFNSGTVFDGHGIELLDHRDPYDFFVLRGLVSFCLALLQYHIRCVFRIGCFNEFQSFRALDTEPIRRPVC